MGPRPPGRRAARGRDFSHATSPRLAAGRVRGGGARRRTHSPPGANSQLPAQNGLCLGPLSPRPRKKQQRSPPKGERCGGKEKAGRAKAPPMPRRARLSGQTTDARGRAAPAEPSRGAGPVPGPGAQPCRLERRTAAGLRSPSGGLGPRGRRPGLAAAWAVTRPGRAKDAPQLFARARAALARGGGSTAGGGQAGRLPQQQPADETGGKRQSLRERGLR